jgi:large subunit ribosomal protein L41
LTSKRGNRTFYKGYGARTEGNHTSKGAYVIRPEKLMKIIAPDLTDFKLKPFVFTGVYAPKRGERVPNWDSISSGSDQQLR